MIEIGEKRLAEMAGPGLHRAADALDRARQAGQPLALDVPEASAHGCAVVESAAPLHDTIVRHWTARTASVIQAYVGSGPTPPTQTAIGERLGLSQQAVWQSLRRGELKVLRRGAGAIRDWLAALEPTTKTREGDRNDGF